MDDARHYRVLFVCTGNTCRSPTAHGLLRARLHQHGLADRIQVDSAGTHGLHAGDPPDPRSCAEALRRGLDISDLRSRELASSDFATSDIRGHDLYVAMDESHVRFLEVRLPRERHGAIQLLLGFAPDADRTEVPDPYYGQAAEYRLSYDLIEQGIDGLVAHLRTAVVDRLG
jgi:protein-tyrosine phosphatase